MRKLFIILGIIFVLVLSLHAQNEFRIGDKLYSQQVTYMTFGQMDGQGIVWNMNDCNVLNDDYLVRFVANRDSFFHAPLSRLEAGINYRYAIQGDTLFLKGFKSKSVRVKYDSPIAIMHLPLVYKDELKGIYSGKGEDIMEHSIRIFGVYETKVCGVGTLITLDSDTLRNTMLVHSQRTISSTFADLYDQLSKYSSLDSIPSLAPDSVSEVIEKDSGKLVMDTYSWFAPGYRYAVFETTKVCQTIPPYMPILQIAFYNAIEDQINLPYDDENAAIRKTVVKNDCSKLDASRRAGKNGITLFLSETISVTISHDGNGMGLSIDYTAEDNDNFSVSLYNIGGMQVFAKDMGRKKKGFHNENFYIDSLSNGVYVLTVFINGTPYSKEISI